MSTAFSGIGAPEHANTAFAGYFERQYLTWCSASMRSCYAVDWHKESRWELTMFPPPHRPH
eukprot:2956716-Pyramimonas_sp.AAC.2